MASSYWIKLYHEVLDDPKMGRLSDHTWRRTIEIFLIAGESGDGGFLPPIEDMAWRLRTTPDDATAVLKELEAVGITSQTEDGWLVCNFASRQDKVSNAERQRRYRERKHKQTYYGNEPSNEEVTGRNTDKDKEEDKEEDTTPPPPKVRPEKIQNDIWVKIKGRGNGIPPSEFSKIGPIVWDAYMRNDCDIDKTVAEGKRYFDAWCSRRGKDGKFYSPMNNAWTDWWVSGEIPEQKNGDPPPRKRIKYDAYGNAIEVD